MPLALREMDSASWAAARASEAAIFEDCTCFNKSRVSHERERERERERKVLYLNAHLGVLAGGLGASVLLVGATTLAAAVIEDGDHGGTARLKKYRERSERERGTIRSAIYYMSRVDVLHVWDGCSAFEGKSVCSHVCVSIRMCLYVQCLYGQRKACLAIGCY